MRLVYTVTNDLTYDQRMIRICSSLARAGHEVLLVGRMLKTSQPLESMLFKQHRLRCWFNKGFAFYAEYNIRLFFYLLFKKFDIYGAIDLDTILPNLLVAKMKFKKCIYDAHEYFTEVPEVENRWLVKAFWGLVARLCIPWVNAAYTVSQSLADIFHKKYRKPFAVIRNLPLKNIAERQEKPATPIIIYQGALNEGRGLEELIEAMPKVHARCILVGEGDLSAQLRDLVDRLNLNHKIEFMGYVKPQHLKAITQQASIGYNVLQLKGLSYYYSLSNKFFDYIQCGIPSVSSPFPEYKTITKKYGVGTTCDCEPLALATAINNILDDAAVYQKMVSACYAAAEIFNWEEEEKKLLAIYEQLS
jgi:glycosyltransferase involved in cell wall biosynthesis